MADVPLSPEGRRARARLAAHRRWHPGDDLDNDQCLRKIEQSHIDDRIDYLMAMAPKMTDEQRGRLRQLVNLPSQT